MNITANLIRLIKEQPILWHKDLNVIRDLKKRNEVWEKLVNELNSRDIPDVQSAKRKWKTIRDTFRDSLNRTSTYADVNSWEHAQSMQFLIPHMKNSKQLSADDTKPSKNGRVKRPKPKYRDITGQDYDYGEATTKRKKIDATSDDEFVIILNDHPESTQAAILQPLPKSETLRPASKRVIVTEESLNNLRRRLNELEQGKRFELTTLQPPPKKRALDLFFESMCETTKKFPAWIQKDVKRKIFEVVHEAERDSDELESKQDYKPTDSPQQLGELVFPE